MNTFQAHVPALALLIAALLPSPASAAPEEATPPPAEAAPEVRSDALPAAPYTLRLSAEVGTLAVLAHRIQFGQEGTPLDYRAEGGQDILFPVSRLSADLFLKQRHAITFLYQPLSLVSQETLAADLTVDEVTLPAGTPTTFRYDFPFWRGSYTYDILPDPDVELAFGLSLQIRNATIAFESLDGTLLKVERDIGPVPVLKARGMKRFERGTWVGFEADGFYAPVSYLNGSDEEIVGAILDASVRGGVALPMHTDAFVNLRYLGGGAVGSSTDDLSPGDDGFTENWLHFLILSLGASYTF